MAVQLPKILDIPEKLLPIVFEFNNFRRMLLTGGRGGGKTQAVARLLLWVASQRKVRIVCGRELQSSIQESVYTVFCDLIDKYNLDFKVFSTKIECPATGTVITFKGFRDQGRANIKGLEGVDILWIDEAETITKETLDIVTPTIRKQGSKMIFTMNRKTRFDPVYLENSARDDCLSIVINYCDNKYCPEVLKKDALECKERSEADYLHIWMGQPLSHGTMMVFNSKDLDAAMDVEFFGCNRTKGSILAIDIANGGGDLTVAGLLEWKSPTRFSMEKIHTWDVKNLMETTGRIQDLKHKYHPDVIVVDATGLGEGVYDRLCELGGNIFDFKGARKSTKKEAFNTRAEAYFKSRDLLEKGELRITDERILKDLEVMSYEIRSDGRKIITNKAKIKKEIQRSPDFADMLSMAVWGLDKLSFQDHSELQTEYNIV